MGRVWDYDLVNQQGPLYISEKHHLTSTTSVLNNCLLETVKLAYFPQLFETVPFLRNPCWQTYPWCFLWNVLGLIFPGNTTPFHYICPLMFNCLFSEIYLKFLSFWQRKFFSFDIAGKQIKQYLVNTSYLQHRFKFYKTGKRFFFFITDLSKGSCELFFW